MLTREWAKLLKTQSINNQHYIESTAFVSGEIKKTDTVYYLYIKVVSIKEPACEGRVWHSSVSHTPADPGLCEDGGEN